MAPRSASAAILQQPGANRLSWSRFLLDLYPCASCGVRYDRLGLGSLLGSSRACFITGIDDGDAGTSLSILPGLALCTGDLGEGYCAGKKEPGDSDSRAVLLRRVPASVIYANLRRRTLFPCLQGLPLSS